MLEECLTNKSKIEEYPLSDLVVRHLDLSSLKEFTIHNSRYTMIAFGKLVPGGCAIGHEVKLFSEQLDRVVKHGFLEYYRLSHCITRTKLKNKKSLLAFISYTAHDFKELNKYLGAECFFEEGCLPEEWDEFKKST